MTSDNVLQLLFMRALANLCVACPHLVTLLQWAKEAQLSPIIIKIMPRRLCEKSETCEASSVKRALQLRSIENSAKPLRMEETLLPADARDTKEHLRFRMSQAGLHQVSKCILSYIEVLLAVHT